MEFYLVQLLNGVSYGLLLFMLSSGLTLIFGMLGVLNFAHASFYMLGAYAAYSIASIAGFWPALLLGPLSVGVLGALFERFCLRRIRAAAGGHIAELLATFGLAYIVMELVQLVWGRGVVDYAVPASMSGPLFTLGGSQFPLYRAFTMAASILIWLVIWLALVRTRTGLVVRAATTHPKALEALGHDVPRIFTLVFGGGCALAGLAGVIGGNTYVTEPGMALSVGGVVIVVVVIGGMGSLAGAFTASLLIGVLQTLAVSIDGALAPVLPYVLLVAMLVWRPRGLFGRQVSEP